MELRGKVNNLSYSLDGKPILSLEIQRMADANSITKLKPDSLYKIKLNEQGSNRTLYQNNLMWAILSDIDAKINGVMSEDGRWKLYIDALEFMGVDYQDLIIPREALDIVKQGCRTTKILEENGNQLLVRCFTGSSKFNKKQMGEIIDYLIRQASDLGIEIQDYSAEYDWLF